MNQKKAARISFGLRALGVGVSALCLGCDVPCDVEQEDDGLGAITAWEQRFVEQEGTPRADAPAFLLGEEGLWLAYREWSPVGWNGRGDIALVIHGSSAHSGLYSVWGETLAKQGILARAIDLRGHGLSLCKDTPCSEAEPPAREMIDDGRYYPGRVGDSLDANQIVRDVAQHISDLHKRWPNARVHLIGHSSGGGVVARYVEHAGGHAVASITLVAPFLHAKQRHADGRVDLECRNTNAYAQIDVGALGAALRGDRHRYVLSFNKAPEYRDALDTLHNTYNTMVGMQVSHLETYRSAFTLPTLWVAADQDTLFDVERSRTESAGFPGPRAFVVVRETSHIGLTWSRAVGALMARWMRMPGTVALDDRIDGGGSSLRR